MEEINNPIIGNEPPFATSEEVSLVNPVRPKGISNQSWEKYMQVFNFAKLKGDPDPNSKAQEAAMNTNWFKKTNGKNNLFNTTVGKSEPGTVKGKEKFKNYNNILDSVNELYNNQALQTPVREPIQEEVIQPDLPIGLQSPELMSDSIPQQVVNQPYEQPILNNFELPQQSNMTGKVASDMNLSNNTLSPDQYLQSNNPKEGNNSFALGGSLDQNPPKKKASKPIKYVENEKDPAYKAYKDSLLLFSSDKDLYQRLKKNGYDEKNTTKFKESDFRKKISETQRTSKTIKKVPNSDLKSVLDFIPTSTIKIPGENRQLFSEKIVPKGTRLLSKWEMGAEVYNEDGKTTYKSYIPAYDQRQIFDYSNVEPQQEVRVKQQKKTPTYKDSLDAYNRGEKQKKAGSKVYPFDKDDIQNGNMTNSDGGIYKRTGILPTKEYVNGDNYSYGYDKPKGTKKTVPVQIRDIQKQVNKLNPNSLIINENEQSISNTDIKQPYNVKSYNISELNNRMNNSTGYGSGRTDANADVEKALRAKESADRYNQSIELRYNNSDVQNNPKAQERYKTLKNTVTINPNAFAHGGSINETYNSDFDSFNVGGSHSENPLGGIPQGIGANGQMNTVEEGETSYKINGTKFIFSDRIKI